MAEFPLRPLDPSVLTECSIAFDSMSRALDVMMLGSVLQANRIVSPLYQYNVFDFDVDGSGVFRVGMHFGWAQSNVWPPFILRPDPINPRLYAQIPGSATHLVIVLKLFESWRRSVVKWGGTRVQGTSIRVLTKETLGLPFR